MSPFAREPAARPSTRSTHGLACAPWTTARQELLAQARRGDVLVLVQFMLGKVLRQGAVSLCGTCMDARGLRDDGLIDGARRGTLSQLADWTVQADKVLVF